MDEITERIHQMCDSTLERKPEDVTPAKWLQKHLGQTFAGRSSRGYRIQCDSKGMKVALNDDDFNTIEEWSGTWGQVVERLNQPSLFGGES